MYIKRITDVSDVSFTIITCPVVVGVKMVHEIAGNVRSSWY
jgi:hypothetical protein